MVNILAGAQLLYREICVHLLQMALRLCYLYLKRPLHRLYCWSVRCVVAHFLRLFSLWLDPSISPMWRVPLAMSNRSPAFGFSQRRTAHGVIRSSICGWRVFRWMSRVSISIITEAWASELLWDTTRKDAVRHTVITVSPITVRPIRTQRRRRPAAAERSTATAPTTARPHSTVNVILSHVLFT